MFNEILLWTVTKEGDHIRALMKPVEGGFEFRLKAASLKVFGLLCKTRGEVQLAATREHAQLVARGWTPVPLRDELSRGDHVLPADTVKEIERERGPENR